MKKIDTDCLEEGLMMTGRNTISLEGRLIRAGVHSFTNHNGMVVKAPDWGIAEAVVPVSKVTTIPEYEELMARGYLVRFYRHKMLTSAECKKAADYFKDHLLGLRYTQKSRMILLTLPIYNAIIDRTKRVPSMRLTWCSQLVKRAFLYVSIDSMDDFNGHKKELFTPKTFENRIMMGMFEDVTDKIVREK